jgi:hypothetical protein
MNIIEYLVAKNFNWYLPDDNIDIDTDIPDDCFGVFVTTRRSDEHKLKSWPEDIHGCIGNWDNNYKTLSKDKIFKYILQTGYQSFFNDERNKYFKPLKEDPHAQIEIDYMLNPIYKVDVNGYINTLNETFDNNKMGLIYENKSTGQRATYLPGVFNDISWNNIKNSLVNKAGATNTENNNIFYAYNIVQLKYKLIECTKANSGYFKQIRKLFIKTVLYHSKQLSFVPFEISYNMINNKVNVNVNKREMIRNTGTIHDILEYIPENNKNSYMKMEGIKETYKYYKQKFIETPTMLIYNKLQEYSFLIPLIEDGEYKMKIGQLYNYFIDNLDKIERQFAFSEIVLCFIKYFQNDKNKIREIIKKIKTYYYKPFKNILSFDDIFQLNWDSKVLNQISKYDNLININKQYIEYWIEYEKLFPYQNITNIETNYLVVLLEGLSHIKYLIKENTQFDKLFFSCFNECVSNRIVKHSEKHSEIQGCLSFISHDNVNKHRIDISCHFYNQI